MTTYSADFNLSDAYRALFRHKWKFTMTFLLVTIVTVIVYCFLPRKYESASRLFVRLGRENAALDATSTLGQAAVVSIPNSRKEEINSVVEMLRNRQILEEVVDDLGAENVLAGAFSDESTSGASLGGLVSGLQGLLPAPPLSDRDRAILKLEKNRQVRSFEESNVIRVTYTSASPQFSQEVVKAIVASYLEDHMQANRTPGAFEFLAEQTEQFRAELSRAESALLKKRDECGLASVAKQEEALVNQVTALQLEYLTTESSLAAEEKEVEELRAAQARLAETQVLQRADGIAHPAAHRMRELLYALELQEQEVLSIYTEKNVKSKQIRQQIENARALLENEQMTAPQTTVGPDRVFEEARTALLAKESSLSSLRAKSKALREQLTEKEEQLAALIADAHQISVLAREVELCDANYRKYAQNLEQSRIDREMESRRISNISVVQPASLNPSPVSPRLVIVIAGGLFLAFMMAACVVALAESRRHRPDSSEPSHDEFTDEFEEELEPMAPAPTPPR